MRSKVGRRVLEQPRGEGEKGPTGIRVVTNEPLEPGPCPP